MTHENDLPKAVQAQEEKLYKEFVLLVDDLLFLCLNSNNLSSSFSLAAYFFSVVFIKEVSTCGEIGRIIKEKWFTWLSYFHGHFPVTCFPEILCLTKLYEILAPKFTPSTNA
ncbi:uncharacterized protein LOC135146625 [Zophobas morio]|jgi:hypothetical protein|uniref:uncharacterized protein LOC135146625 n=1 Tax=Zophobas morio TaxID=2755281 RepID=UPI0030835CCE